MVSFVFFFLGEAFPLSVSPFLSLFVSQRPLLSRKPEFASFSYIVSGRDEKERGAQKRRKEKRKGLEEGKSSLTASRSLLQRSASGRPAASPNSTGKPRAPRRWPRRSCRPRTTWPEGRRARPGRRPLAPLPAWPPGERGTASRGRRRLRGGPCSIPRPSIDGASFAWGEKRKRDGEVFFFYEEKRGGKPEKKRREEKRKKTREKKKRKKTDQGHPLREHGSEASSEALALLLLGRRGRRGRAGGGGRRGGAARRRGAGAASFFCLVLRMRLSFFFSFRWSLLFFSRSLRELLFSLVARSLLLLLPPRDRPMSTGD